MQILKRGVDLYIWRNIQLNKSRLLIFTMLFILATMLSIMNRFPYATVGVILIPMAYILGVYTYQKYILWNSGAFGEDLVTRELEKLDNSHYLINGVVIPPNRGDTDHIVIGPTGIFAIESKNYGGEIECDGDSWTRYKVGRKGRRYDLSIGRPSKQVKRNAKVLKDFILKHSDEIFNGEIPHIWVHSIVVFTNENVGLSMKNPTVNVLRVVELSGYIRNKNPELKLGEKEIKRIGEVIIKYSK
jgi:hypothetical protein